MASSATKFLCFLVIMGLVMPSLASDHYVGGSDGWCAAPKLLVHWLLGERICLHDTLHFVLKLGVELYEVFDEKAYNECDYTGAVLRATSGTYNCQLPERKPYYFIGDRANCLNGVKICVTLALPALCLL